MIDPAEMLALEERALNAWPGLQTAMVDGWMLRAAGGWTKRANSANPLTPSGPFETVRAAAEAFYARLGLPAIFRLTPLASPDADAALAAAGYTLFDPSLVMTTPLAGAYDDGGVRIEPAPSDEWLDGFADVSAVSAGFRPAHDAIAHAISMPAAFASLHDNGMPVGFGLGVCERGVIGLFDIVVAPAQRGRGYGRAIVAALLGWGRQAGATTGTLTVRSVSDIALNLYASFGFAEVYRYHYRIPPG